MKISFLATLTLTVLTGICAASVTLQFSQPGNVLKEISDSAGLSATNNLPWGIVVDTTDRNNGFIDPLGGVGLQLSDGANLGNGYRFYNPAINPDGTERTVFSGTFGGGDGAITQGAFEVPVPFSAKNFAVIWFGSTSLEQGDSLPAGTSYGLIPSSDTLPGDGNSDGYFGLGAAGIKPANLSLVPEPSTALLGLLGLAGILRRKR